VYRSHAWIRGTREIGEKYWHKALIACIRRTPIVGIKVLKKRQNNAVLFEANPILTRSPRGPPNIFPVQHVWKCQQTIDVLKHMLYTQCKLWKSCSMCICWPSLTQVYLPWSGVNRLLDMQGLRNRVTCVI